jgi:hypothetical protein
MRPRRTAHKLKGNHQAGPKSRKPEDTNLSDIKEPKTIAGNSETTSLRNELAKTALNQVGTSTGCIPAGNLASPQSSSRPPKITLKDGEMCFEGDESSFRQTFGTSDPELLSELLHQVAAVLPYRHVGDARDYNHVFAALQGIGPRDPLEGMLSVQMVAGHNLAMAFLDKAASKEQPDMAVDSNLNRATKLQRTFIAQMEALNRHRDKGAHKMIVEEVHVHDRGQAIVGPVSHQSSGVVDEEDDGKSNR